MAPLSLIFSIIMGADNSFYVKSIATYAPTFFGYIISVLAIVWTTRQLKYDRDFMRKTGLDPIGAV